MSGRSSARSYDHRVAIEPTPPYRVALRGGDQPSDVVVNDVSMFRAEMLSDRHLWLACYLPGTGIDGDRITFEVSVTDGGALVFEVVERPTGQVTTE
jgi:hypothetical protein